MYIDYIVKWTELEDVFVQKQCFYDPNGRESADAFFNLKYLDKNVDTVELIEVHYIRTEYKQEPKK